MEAIAQLLAVLTYTSGRSTAQDGLPIALRRIACILNDKMHSELM